MRRFFPISILTMLAFLASACQENLAQVRVGEVEVVYASTVTRVEAANLASFLVEKEWVQKSQSLFLEKEGLSYQVFWEVGKDFDLRDLPHSFLHALGDSLEKSLWPGNEVRLHITNADFTSSWPIDQLPGKALSLAGGATLYYQSSISEKQAQALQRILDNLELGADPGTLIQYQQLGEAHYMRLIPAQREEIDRQQWLQWKQAHHQLQDSLGNPAWFSLMLCDAFFEPQKSIEPNPYAHTLAFETDRIQYTGDILSKEAEQLGDFLKEQGILRNAHRKISVRLQDDRYVLMFKTRLSLRNAQTGQKAHELGVALSKYVFRGLPVDVHLYDHSRKHQVFRMN